MGNIRQLRFDGGERIMPERVIKLLEQEYEKAKKYQWIHNPLAYALYRVWRIVDREGTEKN